MSLTNRYFCRIMALLTFPEKPLEFTQRLTAEETLENPINPRSCCRAATEWVPKVQEGVSALCQSLSNLSGKKTELMVMR